jgi:hypothetical protein
MTGARWDAAATRRQERVVRWAGFSWCVFAQAGMQENERAIEGLKQYEYDYNVKRKSAITAYKADLQKSRDAHFVRSGGLGSGARV